MPPWPATASRSGRQHRPDHGGSARIRWVRSFTDAAAGTEPARRSGRAGPRGGAEVAEAVAAPAGGGVAVEGHRGPLRAPQLASTGGDCHLGEALGRRQEGRMAAVEAHHLGRVVRMSAVRLADRRCGGRSPRPARQGRWPPPGVGGQVPQRRLRQVGVDVDVERLAKCGCAPLTRRAARHRLRSGRRRSAAPSCRRSAR